MFIKWNYPQTLTYAINIRMSSDVRGLIREGKRPTTIELDRQDLGTLLGQLRTNPAPAIDYIKNLYQCLANQV